MSTRLEEARAALDSYRAGTNTSPGPWTLRFDERPWTVNAERRWSPFERAEIVKRWRHAFGTLARAAGIPPCGRIVVHAYPHARSRRALADTGACYGAVKAAVDGLVDADIVVNDGPDYVAAIVLHAPQVTGADALELHIERIES